MRLLAWTALTAALAVGTSCARDPAAAAVSADGGEAADAASVADATAFSDGSSPDVTAPVDAATPPDSVAPPPPFRVRVLTYNMQWAGNADYQVLSDILNQKATTNEAPDVVLLEECFNDAGDDGAPYPTFATALATLYPYQWHGPMAESKATGSGLVLLSRYPMIDRQKYAFTAGLPPDSLANKGIAWASLKLPPGCGPLGVLDTHTQAGTAADFGNLFYPAETRLTQTYDITDRLGDWQQGNATAVLMGGDFNYFTEEADPTGFNGYYVLTHAWSGWLHNSEVFCATNSATCAAPGLPLSVELYGMLKLFFGETARTGVRPVAVRKYGATEYGGLGDHESFEVDYEITCR